MSHPAWESDPTTRHEYRWWDGEKWTEYVADDGVQALDPLTGTENLKPPRVRSSSPTRRLAGTTGQSAFPLDHPVALASRTARIGARFIDMAVFVVLTVVLLFALHFTDIRPIPIDEPYDSNAYEAYVRSLHSVLWALIAATAIYEIALTALKGQTIGKMATRIQVVRAGDLFQPELGRPPLWGRSFLRWALPTALGLPGLVVPFIGQVLWLLCYLSLMWDRERQGWHDKIADTFVVQKP